MQQQKKEERRKKQKYKKKLENQRLGEKRTESEKETREFATGNRKCG